MVPGPVVAEGIPPVTLPSVDSMNECIAAAKRKLAIELDSEEGVSFDPQGRLLTDGSIFQKKTTISLDYSEHPLYLAWVQAGLRRVGEEDPDVRAGIVEALNNTPKGSIIPLQQEFYFQLALVSRMYQKVLEEKGISGLSKKIQKAHQAAMKEVNLLVRDAFARALYKAYRAGEAPSLDLAVLNKELDKARKSIAPKAHSVFVKHIRQETGQKFSQKDLDSLIKTHPEGMTASPDDLLHLDASLGVATWIEGTETTAHRSNQGIVAQRLWGTYGYVEGARLPIPRLPTLAGCGLIKMKIHPEALHPDLLQLEQFHKPSYALWDRQVFYIDESSKIHQLSIGTTEASVIQKIFAPFPAAEDFSQEPILAETLPPEQLKQLNSLLIPAPPIRIRTPSMVSEESGLKTPEKKVEQVNRNLQEIHRRYLAKGQLEQPFVYNVLMSLSSRNDQNDRIEHILLGAHQYNKDRQPTDSDPWCLVQAIATNGFGSELGYGPFGFHVKVRQEATLMAEMALVATIQGSKKADMAPYSAFLNTYSDKNPYFYKTKEGKETQKSIQTTKDSWKKERTSPSGNAHDDAKLCLKKMVANDAHFSHKYARLIQSLSVFVEPVSIAGCKSGNERAQGISSRDVLLDAMERLAADGAPYPESHRSLARTLKGALANLAESTPKTYAKRVEELNKALDDFYNQVGLQGAMTLIADTDMGAASKVDAQMKVDTPWFKGGVLKTLWQFIKTIGNWSTNRAESSALTNLSQTTSFMQPHKGTFLKLIRNAFRAEGAKGDLLPPAEQPIRLSDKVVITLERAAKPKGIGVPVPTSDVEPGPAVIAGDARPTTPTTQPSETSTGDTMDDDEDIKSDAPRGPR